MANIQLSSPCPSRGAPQRTTPNTQQRLDRKPHFMKKSAVDRDYVVCSVGKLGEDTGHYTTATHTRTSALTLVFRSTTHALTTELHKCTPFNYLLPLFIALHRHFYLALPFTLSPFVYPTIPPPYLYVPTSVSSPTPHPLSPINIRADT